MLRELSILLATLLSPATVPTTQPASRPMKQIVEYPLPADNELHKLVDPIARNYGISLPAKTFEELRAIRYTEDGQMHKMPAAAKHPVQFAVFSPASYQPEKPAGLIVWIAPEAGAEMRDDWADVLDRHNIIFIAPREVPNESYSPWRIFMATEAVRHAKTDYRIDPDRIYIAGLSGGGRVSSHAAVFFPDTFNGAICIVGSNFYRDVPAGPKQIYPGFWPNPNSQIVARGRANSRLVLLTGSRDFNRNGTKAAYDAYVADEWRHVTYLEVPEMGHARPDADWFEKAVVALDAPLREMARDQYDRGLALEQKHKPGEACLLFESCALHGDDQTIVTDAQYHAKMIRQKIVDQILNIRNLIENHKYDAASSRARQLKSDFNPIANDDAIALIARINELRKSGN